jgi:ferritin
MITKPLLKLLNEQIGHELSASQTYLAVAVYFARMGLDGWAAFFYRQSEEERGHALKIVRFLVDVDADFDFPAVPAAKPKFKSALEAVQQCYAWEQTVTKQFHKMCDAALANKDYTTFQFLQWFVEEQVEEEATMQKLIQIAQIGTDLLTSEPFLPQPE